MAEERVTDWVNLLHARFPPSDAEEWDSVGLQVGDPEAAVRAVLVCLDVTRATLAEAEQRGAQLVIAHHPLLFRPLARLTPDSAPGVLALAAARAGIAVAAAHTNFDVAEPGTSEPVCRLLDLRAVQPLARADWGEASTCKLVTFVPRDDTLRVLGALAEAGAGIIGEYDHCAFRVGGTGSFRPSAAANPTLGEREQVNEVGEDRLEMVVPLARLGAVVATLHATHPYEEVAFDVYPLLAARRGLGRVGDLPQPLPLRRLAGQLAEGLPAPGLRVAGDPDRPVRRVAVCGGAGDALVAAARRAGADVYVTGDLRHHVALDALTTGLAVIDAGHYATEAAALPFLRQALAEGAGERGLTAALLASAVTTEPWTPWQGGTP